MLIIAHRGASAYYKENTLESFSRAYDMGARYFETDVQLSSDNRLVLYHDYHFKNKDGQERAVKDTDAASLAACGVPYLEQLFEVLPNDAKINLEIKNDANLYPSIERKLLKTLDALSIDNRRILISSFDYPTLMRLREFDSDIKIGVLTRSFNLTDILALNAYSVHMSAERITPAIVDTCLNAGLKIFAYTVNDAKKARELEETGVSGVFSDYPDLLCLLRATSSANESKTHPH